MGVALYRKYRSTSLDEVVGQKHITDTLKNALKSGKLSHAYLLTGPRGVGKTSVARILAYAVNDMAYKDTKAQLDIIEIDAASNRKIDEIRNLRDKVHVLPTQTKYKVYIIDEVHMLTREAFNALLKTLEEPPAHVLFILATTEAHKLPETIISRTQHFAFKPIDRQTISDHLATIAKAEKIDIDEAAIDLIAQHSGGSFRDSISLLDQARHIATHISRDDVLSLLGIAPQETLLNIAETIQTGTAKELLSALQVLKEKGVTAPMAAKQLGEILRDKLVHGTFSDIDLLRALLEVPTSNNPDRLLELTLLDALPVKGVAKPTMSIDETKKISESKATKATIVKPVPTTTSKAATAVVSRPKRAEQKDDENSPSSIAATPTGEDFTIEAWPQVLSAIKKQYNTLYGILRMAEPNLDNDTLVLSFRFAFHEKQLKESKNHRVLSDVLAQMYNQPITISCIVADKQTSPKTAPQKSSSNHAETVSNIFGGAEVLES